ncbi:MAG TPA: biopolymer transporter ExbD [Gammaproteobacteria bacterium]
MKNTRRIKRMSRGLKKKRIPGMNLVSLMDVFTILVFFLLVNSSAQEVLSDPKVLDLPESVAEDKPEQTLVIMVTADQVLLKGEVVVSVEEILALEDSVVPALRTALLEESSHVAGLTAESVLRSREITIMGDRSVPFKILKKVMASCTSVGYEKISLAVIQKASQAT